MIVVLKSNEKLSKCPFCGSNPELKMDGILKQGTSQATPHYWVKCTNEKCATSPSAVGSLTEAIDNWNKRAA